MPNVDLSVINSLRRTILVDLDIYAIGNVKIIEKNTPYDRDLISHRTELIPVIETNEIKEGLKFSASMKADKDSNYLLSDHLKVEGSGNSPFLKDLLIVQLRTGINTQESIKLTGEIVRGTMKDNAKFQCVTVAGIKDNNTLTFTPRGQISGKEILKRGINKLLSRVKGFKENIEDKTNNKVQIEETGELHTIIIDNEDDTLGNMIQNMLMPHYEFVSYNRIHPAEYKIIIKIKTNEPVKALYKACDLIEKEIKKINFTMK